MHVINPRPGNAIVVFEWSTEHGECYDCGLPAAFRVELYPKQPEADRWEIMCAVCAVEHAISGETVERIKPDEDEPDLPQYDPNEGLRAVRELASIRAHVAGKAYPQFSPLSEEVERLDNWLNKGGYLPDGWSAPCRKVEASSVAANLVLDAPWTDDGRSPWYWIRLPNGDLVLAVFPRGDTYEYVSDLEGV